MITALERLICLTIGHTVLPRTAYVLRYWSLLNWRNFRFRCGSVAVAVNWLFVFISSFLRCLRTLYIVWSLVRRRVTRRLTRRQTMCSVLKYCKIIQTGSVRLRFGCVIFSVYCIFTSHYHTEYEWLRVILTCKKVPVTSSDPIWTLDLDETPSNSTSHPDPSCLRLETFSPAL